MLYAASIRLRGCHFCDRTTAELLHSRSAKTALHLTVQHAHRSSRPSPGTASNQCPAHQGCAAAPRRWHRRPRRRPSGAAAYAAGLNQWISPKASFEIYGVTKADACVNAAARRRRVAAGARVPPHGRKSARGGADGRRGDAAAIIPNCEPSTRPRSPSGLDRSRHLRQKVRDASPGYYWAH